MKDGPDLALKTEESEIFRVLSAKNQGLDNDLAFQGAVLRLAAAQVEIIGEPAGNHLRIDRVALVTNIEFAARMRRLDDTDVRIVEGPDFLRRAQYGQRRNGMVHANPVGDILFGQFLVRGKDLLR